MRARLFQPARNAMQSGTAKTKGWVMEFEPTGPRAIDPLMGWTSTSDASSQIRLRFDSRKAAEDYARDKGITLSVVEPGHKRAPNIRPRGYGENFAFDRRSPWTH